MEEINYMPAKSYSQSNIKEDALYQKEKPTKEMNSELNDRYLDKIKIKKSSNSIERTKYKYKNKIRSLKEDNHVNINISQNAEITKIKPQKINCGSQNLLPCYKNKILNAQACSINRKNIYLPIIIIFLLFPNFAYECNHRIFNSYNSIITIKVQGSGIQSIFYGGSTCSAGTFTRPKEIHINNIKQDNIMDKYNFINSTNFVKLIWNNTISNCNCLFQDCINIIEIDFSEFDFSTGLYGYQMFYNCKSLTSLNFNSYKWTIKIYNLASMFTYCESLTSLDITNFEISLIHDTSRMFEGCHSLISLDLSNFNNDYLTNCQNMFSDCPNLIYVDLRNAHYCNYGANVNGFLSGSQNIVFCTYCTRIEPIIDSHNCAVKDCTINWRQSQLKINLADNTCVSDCSLTTNNKYLYLSKCYVSCPEGTYTENLECKDCHPDCKTCIKPEDLNGSNCQLCKSSDKCLKKGNCIPISESKNGYYLDENDNSIKICKCDLIKCSKCSEESLKINLCLTCNEGYYPKENDNHNKNSFIDCYQSQEGYYLDNNNNNPFFKLCYESCQKCDKGGNEFYHNCIECKSDYYFELNRNSYKNCYINCPYYYYHDKDKYLCTEFLECPENYSKLINDTNECIYKCEEHSEYIYEFKNKCYKECPESTIAKRNGTLCQLVCTEDKPFEMISLQECFKYCPIKDILTGECILNYKTDEVDYETKAHDIMLGNIEHGFTSVEYDIIHLENGEEDIIKYGKIIVTLSTLRNQRNITNNNETFIDLKECEDSLRHEYNISDGEDLFIKKIDITQDGFRIPKIEYDIYYKIYDINGTYLKKLNLSACKDINIDLSIPIVLNEDIDKLNESGDYYNDICYPTTSESGTDITLDDRRKEFINSNNTVCQEDCYLADYDKDNQRAKCSCKAKESVLSFIDMKINTSELYQQFTDIDNIINIKIIFCYKQLFCKEGIINNIIFFVILPFILLHIIVIIIFYCNQKKKLDKKIKNICLAIDNFDLLKESTKNGKVSSSRNKNKYKNNIETSNDKKKNKLLKAFSRNFFSTKKKHHHHHFPPKKKSKKEHIIKLNNKNNNYYFKNKNDKSNKSDKADVVKKIKKIMTANIEEMNTLSYKAALKLDKRSYCKYYISLIKSKNILFFSFYYSDDYNAKIIKIDLFFISFITFFTVNALFFNDSTMHRIFLDQGSFNLMYQLPQIVYSSLISSIFDILLKLFSLSEGIILEFKKNKNIKGLKRRKKKLKKILNIKFILYFSLSFLILLCFWYYLSMFGVIYKNTQVCLIKDTLISFALSLVYPFGIYLIPGFCRIPALFNIKNKREILYKISLLLQVI